MTPIKATRPRPGRTVVLALLSLLVGCQKESDERSLVGSGNARATASGSAPIIGSSSSAPPGPPASGVSVRGASMDVPPGFVPLEPERVERLRQAALGMDPTATVTMDAKRGKSMMDGVGYVQRSETKLSSLHKHGRARDVYAREMASLEIMWMIAGLKIVSLETKVGPGGGTACSVTIQSQRGQSVELHSCMQETMTRDGLTVVGASCMQAVGASLCAKMMESRRFDTGPGIDLDESMGPPIAALDLGAFSLGATKEAFLEACKKHGLKPLDPAKEKGEVRAALEAGQAFGCKGSDPKFAWGPLTRVTGDALNGRVGSLVFEVQRPPEENNRKLDEVYGTDIVVDRLDNKRFIWPDAKDFEALGVRAAPSSSGKSGESSLNVFSRALFDAANPRPKN